jgi:hypothetical protein
MTTRQQGQRQQDRRHNGSRDEYGRFESASEGSRYSYRFPDDQFVADSAIDEDRRDSHYGQARDEFGRFESEGGYTGGSESYRGSDNDRGSGGYPNYNNPGSNSRGDNGHRERRGEGSYRTEVGSSSSQRRRPGMEQGRQSYMQQNQPSLGQFSGRGPKGYARADARIEEDVNEALSQDSQLDATDIEVKVEAGVVTLTGTVSERKFKRMAEDLCEECSGVKEVLNEIRVKRESETSSNASGSEKSKGGSNFSSSESRSRQAS